MKVLSLFSILGLSGIFLLSSVFADTSAPGSVPELVVYAYDSFVSPDSWGRAIVPEFEKKYACRVKVLAAGDGGQILTRLQLDSKRAKKSAHIVVGIDQHIWDRAKPWLENWGSWEPQGYSQLLKETRIENGFLPYDYGVLGLIANQRLLSKYALNPPCSVRDLLKPEWKRNLILEDPRTSTPGLSFLLFTQTVLGDQVWDFWSKLRSQWLTLAPGWEGAYGLFLRDEAPLVWSYFTSQAYQEERQENKLISNRYHAIPFQEGQPMQIEGAAWVKGALETPIEKQLAKHFLEYLISPEAQTLLPKTQWMMPVLSSTELPISYRNLPKPTRLIRNKWSGVEVEAVLKRWNQVLN